MKTKAQLDKQIEELRNAFGNLLYASNIEELQKFFKNYFNKDIIQVGDHLIYDFTTLFNMSPKVRKQFNNDPIQSITVTYKRLDLIFFTYDKHPDLGENYITWDSDWMKYLYPIEVKQSVLWANKAYLKEKNPDEYYIQVNSFDLNNKYGKLIKDIDFSDYKNII